MLKMGIDYSWARPGGAFIAAAGFEFVVRYVPYQGDQGKGLEAKELEELRANGLAVCLVFESTADRAMAGFAAGVTDARTSVSAQERLGFPLARPVYFAIDFDAQPHQFAQLEGYFEGVNSVMGVARTGVYGGTLPLRHLQERGLAAFYWQALGWNRGIVEGRHLWQSANNKRVNGGEVDWNQAFREDYGQWEAKEDEVTRAEYEELRMDVDRLERLLGAHGIAKDPAAYAAAATNEERQAALTFGDGALAYADERGWSAFLGIGLARLEASKPALTGGPIRIEGNFELIEEENE